MNYTLIKLYLTALFFTKLAQITIYIDFYWDLIKELSVLNWLLKREE